MTKKYRLLSDLYQETCKKVTASPKNWEAFLRSACNNYKLRFDEQLLVYAQRPDAVAVLSMNEGNKASWNHTFRRWVNRGAKGIAVFGDIRGASQSIKYYFDISDTHPSYYTRPVPLWEMQPKYEADVINDLERTYGTLEDKTTLVAAVFSASKNATKYYLEEYTSDLLYVAQDSFLSGLADDMITSMYKQVVENSMAYMILSRLGVNTEAYFEDTDFENIFNFNTHETLTALGIATGNLAKVGLREIAQTIFSLENKNRIIVDSEKNVYNEEKTEGGLQNGSNHIQNARRIPDTGVRVAGTTGGNIGSVRTDAEEVSYETPLHSVLQSLDQGYSGRASGRGREASNRDGGTFDQAVDGERRDNRTSEGKSVYDLDPEDEQYPEYGSGNREDGSNLQLNEITNLAEEKNSAFSFSKDQYEYRLGDKVYIGASEYEILSLGDNRVLLYDTSFPMVNREEDFVDFERMVKDNPLNDHLKSANRSPVTISEPVVAEVTPTKEAEVEITVETPIEEIKQITPQWERKNPSKVQTFDLHPDIPMASRNNFDLKSHSVEEVGKKERFSRNLEAIRILKTCETENRFATPGEQVALSKYVGWGGIPEAFDDQNSAWIEQYHALKNILSEEEYISARESVLTAFYTPPAVINGMYKALEQMGFVKGNILEPACGIGNFMGLLPTSMEQAKFYGVELDKISAGIAQNLYQTASIAQTGYEKADIPDSFFDVVVGNVPFGDIRLNDRRYDKHHFLIHDYFLAKSLDKLRPGGVMAIVTSKGTMDKKNPAVRKYLAQRAELLGAIRLPNNTFLGNAGTKVVSDILFFQKRDRLMDIEPDWVHLDVDEAGREMNDYFVHHPEMVLGKWKTVSGRFGEENTVVPFEGENLESLIFEAVSNIGGEITPYETELEEAEEDNSIPADPSVRNFSYTVLNDTIYFRENSFMTPLKLSASVEGRIKSMISIRDSARRLLELQLEDYPEEDIQKEQKNLNTLYDRFTTKYGLINSRTNTSAMYKDSSFPLISALEVLNDDGTFKCKADMFYKRTIKPNVPVTYVETSSEALTVSLGEKAGVDMDFMCSLTGKTEADIYSDLRGVIFLNPLYNEDEAEAKYLTADEYLSGNIREKLVVATKLAEGNPEQFSLHVEALKKAQPKDLSASEIFVRLGSTWVPPEIIEEFMFSLLDTPMYCQRKIKAHYSTYTSEWNIENKNYDINNVKAHTTFGTSRINAYKIIEETLNLKDVRIFDYLLDEHGNKKAVLNSKETAIAQAKQEQIKQSFKDWIWTDPIRRDRLCKLYNERFNSTRPREYNGSHIQFHGMNPDITLRTHQKNAVARILYGKNTLLAHVVGAGKTFEMVAAAMELKRLGLCNKSLFVVPNHLTTQWAAEFMLLYPAANILVTTNKDFETRNRKRFCGRIATGDYDAVIIGHSQFEKIPMSIERQRILLERQRDEVMQGLAELTKNHGERFSIKQLEKAKKAIEQKLEKLNKQWRKDDLVTFEELGIDRIFVDESHNYKNLFLYTKMRNVGGIAQTEAQKSSDLFMKCQYLDEITGGKGIVFATGTPISNSMVELYTIQRYLQYNTLKEHDLQHFDAWASNFGETVTALELKPEGTGYRTKTRFARFYNLPELMAMFKEVADIQTADMLNLPVPKVRYHNISVKPSDIQKEMIAELSRRADAVRNGMVRPNEDNMLRITNDGRKLALDQRLINPMLPDFEGSKLNACVNYLYETWLSGTEKRLTQLFFCDLSTPKTDGSFSVYNDIREKLIARGVPENEISFIHEADTEAKKQTLFQKVRSGDIRILMGSTQKMGAGTNVQNKLIASHDFDCPWRPSDLEQRLGRIARQGNENSEVDVYRFVTEGTFDAYLYQLVESKQRFASQIMSSKSPVRSAEDIDETALSYAEIKMLATGNPHIKEKMDLDIQVQKLNILKASYLSEKYALEDKIHKNYPQQIAMVTEKISALKQDIHTAEKHPKPQDDRYVGIEVDGVFYSDKQKAGEKILEACKFKIRPEATPLGKYRGFSLTLSFDVINKKFVVTIHGKGKHPVALGDDVFGNLTRIDNAVERLSDELHFNEMELADLKNQLETAKLEVEKPFSQEKELREKTARLQELNVLLNLDKTENEIAEDEVCEVEIEQRKKEKDYER